MEPDERGDEERRAAEEAQIDEALDESFPASDSPAWSVTHLGPPKHPPGTSPPAA